MILKNKGNRTPTKNTKQRAIFTARELEVLKAMSMGLTDVEIATHLKISKYTVSGHRKKMMMKSKAKNSCQLVYMACRKKII